MNKKLQLTIIGILFTLQSYSQINNFSDLIYVSNLSLYELTDELQYSWKILKPQQDTSEKGFITGRYRFSYNKNGVKQILQRSGRTDLKSMQTIWITNLICSDKSLLNRIVKSLEYNGYELKGRQGSQSIYEDGNNIIMVDKNYKSIKKLVVYNITVVTD